MSQYSENWAKAESKAKEAGLGIVEHGWEQHVIIDQDNSYVYRYPRGKSGLAKLQDEVFIIKKLEKFSWDIEIPRLIEFNGKRAKYKLVGGQVLDNKTLSLLSNSQIANLGAGLGRFLAKLHGCPKSIVKHKAWVQKGTLLEYYEHHIKAAPPGNPWKDKATRALNELKNLQADTVSSVPVHGDLHGLNIVIDKNTKKLSGIIDFSEVEVGDRHQDFRKIFTTAERLLRPAIHEYAVHSGKKLCAELAKNWAYVNEWSNACRFASQPRNATYHRAISNLGKWNQLS